MVRGLEHDTRRVKRNRTGEKKLLVIGNRESREYWVAYPIIRSNCSCLMFVDTLQSTCPDPSVIAKAWAMSFWISGGMLELVSVAPTEISDEPRCSNSPGPVWVISTPDTNDKTTLVGKRCSKCDSTPRVFVVLTNIHVCWGVTTDSMMAAKSYTSGSALTHRIT